MIGKSSGVVVAAMVCGCCLVTSTSVCAQVSAEVQFQRDLLGTVDTTRVTAMKMVVRRKSDARAASPIVAQALIELANGNRFESLKESGQSDLPEGIQLMFQFVGMSDHPTSTPTLVQLLRCQRFSWRMAALDQLCKPGRDLALNPVIALIHSPDFRSSYGFRFALARGLTRFRHPRAWFALLDLYQEVDGLLAHRMNRAFEKVTVADFRGDMKSFQRWSNLVGQANSQRVLSPDSSLSSDPNVRLRLKPSKYYGIDIHAQKLLFVIDRSASMANRSGASTRLAKAKQELIEAIRELDAHCEFSVVVFSNHVFSWKKQLVIATEENKGQAIEFVDELRPRGDTNTYDALRKALDFDQQLEAMFVLTDGEPTAGAKTQHSEILTDILQRNQTRHVTINTVALAVDARMQRFLRELTLPSEGEFRIVN